MTTVFEEILSCARTKNKTKLDTLRKDVSINLLGWGRDYYWSPIAELAYLGEHDAVMWLFEKGGSLQAVVAGYVMGKHTQPLTRWINQHADDICLDSLFDWKISRDGFPAAKEYYQKGGHPTRIAKQLTLGGHIKSAKYACDYWGADDKARQQTPIRHVSEKRLLDNKMLSSALMVQSLAKCGYFETAKTLRARDEVPLVDWFIGIAENGDLAMLKQCIDEFLLPNDKTRESTLITVCETLAHVGWMKAVLTYLGTEYLELDLATIAESERSRTVSDKIHIAALVGGHLDALDLIESNPMQSSNARFLTCYLAKGGHLEKIHHKLPAPNDELQSEGRVFAYLQGAVFAQHIQLLHQRFSAQMDTKDYQKILLYTKDLSVYSRFCDEKKRTVFDGSGAIHYQENQLNELKKILAFTRSGNRKFVIACVQYAGDAEKFIQCKKDADFIRTAMRTYGLSYPQAVAWRAHYLQIYVLFSEGFHAIRRILGKDVCLNMLLSLITQLSSVESTWLFEKIFVSSRRVETLHREPDAIRIELKRAVLTLKKENKIELSGLANVLQEIEGNHDKQSTLIQLKRTALAIKKCYDALPTEEVNLFCFWRTTLRTRFQKDVLSKIPRQLPLLTDEKRVDDFFCPK